MRVRSFANDAVSTHMTDTGEASQSGTTTTEAEHAARAWNADVRHSDVGFKVKHFFTPVSGVFKSYDIDLTFNRDDPESSAVKVKIDVSSIDTKNEERDAHLMSSDFFDAEKFPEITFESTSVEEVSSEELVAHGRLTIKDTTKEVDLPIHFLGVKDLPDEVGDALGGIRQVASFESELTIDRRDFEVGVGSWAQTLVVGSDVDISISVEANR